MACSQRCKRLHPGLCTLSTRFNYAVLWQVRECLLALPQQKWVFTNCNEKHARLALETLDLLVGHTLWNIMQSMHVLLANIFCAAIYGQFGSA